MADIKVVESFNYKSIPLSIIDDIKKEIDTNLSWYMYDEYGNETALHKMLMEIIDKHISDV